MQKAKDHSKPDCDKSWNITVPISGKYCKIDAKPHHESVHCHLEQGDACKDLRDTHVKTKPIHVKIEQKDHEVEAPCFDVNVDVHAKCIKPGKAIVHGGNVIVGKQEIVIDVIESEIKYGKPTYNVHCKPHIKEIEPPKIEYKPGKIVYQCKPHVTINRCSRKPKPCPCGKDNCHHRREQK
jgi:hypothetical protein